MSSFEKFLRACSSFPYPSQPLVATSTSHSPHPTSTCSPIGLSIRNPGVHLYLSLLHYVTNVSHSCPHTTPCSPPRVPFSGSWEIPHDPQPASASSAPPPYDAYLPAFSGH